MRCAALQCAGRRQAHAPVPCPMWPCGVRPGNAVPLGPCGVRPGRAVRLRPRGARPRQGRAPAALRCAAPARPCPRGPAVRGPGKAVPPRPCGVRPRQGRAPAALLGAAAARPCPWGPAVRGPGKAVREGQGERGRPAEACAVARAGARPCLWRRAGDAGRARERAGCPPPPAKGCADGDVLLARGQRMAKHCAIRPRVKLHTICPRRLTGACWSPRHSPSLAPSLSRYWIA